MPNKLIDESSPYLLQHANNPVDWYPWGDEAFGRAQQENKPVLVSIGYAACHWCHVMEHESFEDETVAAFMNEHFICIKVDREEHPDVDHLYMDALQAMSGSGGWPLNMFVTPDRKPFYGGTYFPPKSMYGRSSWMELLVALQRAWAEKPEEITLQSEQMLKHLVQASTVESVAAGAYQISQQDIDSIATNLLRNADKDYGGFGGAPKFPPTGSIQFLLDYNHLQEDKNNALAKEALEHALLSLDKMIEGGIYDQIGGGFSRYATDVQWLVPHFEKMLYDNALLVSVLSNAYRITKKERYRRTIEDTIRFCRRELGAADSPGFYCALDADSEGVEGKFYTWTWKDWTALMGHAHPALAAYFGVSEQGNWEEANILNVALDDEEICNRYQLDPGFWEQLKEDAKHRLLVKRTERIRPATDDKMLLSWNALMNIALVDAALALEHETYLQDALAHARWMLQVFRDEQGKLLHTYKNGRARIMAKLDDYAYLIKALYHAAAASLDTSLLLEAAQLMEQVEAEFLHEDRNFFYFSSQLQRDIPVRKVELYDGATPAANSMMMENLWNMGNLMERSNWIEQSEAMMFAQKQAALRYPSSFARWAIWLQRYNTGLKQLVIAGTDAEAMLSEWHRDYYPQVFAVAATEDGAGVKALQHKYVAGVTRLYVCAQFVCKSPVQSVAEARGSIRN